MADVGDQPSTRANNRPDPGRIPKATPKNINGGTLTLGEELLSSRIAINLGVNSPIDTVEHDSNQGNERRQDSSKRFSHQVKESSQKHAASLSQMPRIA